MRADRTLQTVKQQNPRCSAFGTQTVKLEEVAVGCIPSFQRGWRWCLTPEEFSPQSLQMAARNPPGRPIDYLALLQVFFTHNSGSQKQLEVQIFGIKKSADTRKALRFFSERRIRTHFVDLLERPAALGELRRFAQKFGVMALVDKGSKRFDELGLRYAQLSDDRWLEKLSEEPLLLRMPLVRNANQLAIGAAEDTWNTWVGR
jgi:arsenate reductase-like glutaredoxin family protein